MCYQDVILGDDLERVVALLEPGMRPVHVVVLAPSAASAQARDSQRNKTGYVDWSAAELDVSLRDETPRIGFWIDSTDLVVDQTVDAILANVETARVG